MESWNFSTWQFFSTSLASEASDKYEVCFTPRSPIYLSNNDQICHFSPFYIVKYLLIWALAKIRGMLHKPWRMMAWPWRIHTHCACLSLWAFASSAAAFSLRFCSICRTIPKKLQPLQQHPSLFPHSSDGQLQPHVAHLSGQLCNVRHGGGPRQLQGTYSCLS